MSPDERWEAFEEWFSANEERFRRYAFTLRDVAYAAWVASRERVDLEQVAEQETLPGIVE